MKVTVVPAQVTTIEDRIAGNLGLSQLMLLAAPVFGGSVLYVLLPPTFHNAAYKLVAIVILFLLCSLLAIRIKGKIILFWLVVLLRYTMRPRYYVFDKRSPASREDYRHYDKLEYEEIVETKPKETKQALRLSTAQLMNLHKLIENPAANLSFESKKGGLYVRITEIKQEG